MRPCCAIVTPFKAQRIKAQRKNRTHCHASLRNSSCDLLCPPVKTVVCILIVLTDEAENWFCESTLRP